MALQRALAVLLRVPDGGPAGDLAAGARRGGHADPAGGGPQLSAGDGLPHVLHAFQIPPVEVAQGFADIQHAAAADGDNRFRREVLRLLPDLKQLLHRRVRRREHHALCLKAAVLFQQRGHRGVFQSLPAPCQHKHPLFGERHSRKHRGQPAQAAVPLYGAHRVVIPIHSASPFAMRRFSTAIASGSSRMESITRSAPACR